MELTLTLWYDRGGSWENLPPEEVLECGSLGWTLVLGCPQDEGDIPLPKVSALYPPFVREMYEAEQRGAEWWMSHEALLEQVRGAAAGATGLQAPNTAVGPVPPAEMRAWGMAWLEAIRSAPPDEWQAFVHDIIWQDYDPEPDETAEYGTPEQWAERLKTDAQSVIFFATAAERAGVPLKAQMGSG